MISSGLTIQRRGQFEKGFPSNRERVRIQERPNDQAVNFNTSQYYPESIPLPGVAVPSQIKYKQIFGKTTTPDERNYFLTYGVAQNTLAKAKATRKVMRGPIRERMNRQDQEMLEGAYQDFITVRHHLDPSVPMVGVEQDFGPMRQGAPSVSTESRRPSTVVSGSRDESMVASTRDEDIVANSVLADVNELLPELILSPTEDAHIQARTQAVPDITAFASPSPVFGADFIPREQEYFQFTRLPPIPPPNNIPRAPPMPPVVGVASSSREPNLTAIEQYLSRGSRPKGKGVDLSDIKSVKLKKASERKPNVFRAPSTSSSDSLYSALSETLARRRASQEDDNIPDGNDWT